MGCKSDDGRRFPFKTAKSRRKRLRPGRAGYCLPAVSNELFSEGRPLPEILEEVAWLAQLLMQAALEADVTESCPAAAATSGPRPVRTGVSVPGTGKAIMSTLLAGRSAA